MPDRQSAESGRSRSSKAMPGFIGTAVTATKRSPSNPQSLSSQQSTKVVARHEQALASAADEQILAKLDALRMEELSSTTSSLSSLAPEKGTDIGLMPKKQRHPIRRPPDGQSPIMTKAARLRQASTASKMSLRDKDDRDRPVIAKVPSTTSLRGRPTRVTHLAQPGNKVSETPSGLAQTSTNCHESSNCETQLIRGKDGKSPMSGEAAQPRPSSVASAISRRRPSVSSTKSTETTKSTKRIANLTSTSVPPLEQIHARMDTPGKPDRSSASRETLRSPPGVTLQVGIECVITHGQSKFKAVVRYLGKVYFDNESYVGVEVPADSPDLPLDLNWTDGTVDGVQVRLSNRI